MRKFNHADLKKLEGYWIELNELKEKLKYREWQLLHAYKEEDTNVGGGRSSNISNPTEQKAIKLAEDKTYQNLKNVINVIEKLYPELDDVQKKIVRMKYWDSEEWDWNDIAKETNVSRSKALAKRNALIDKTAERLGWV